MSQRYIYEAKKTHMSQREQSQKSNFLLYQS